MDTKVISSTDKILYSNLFIDTRDYVPTGESVSFPAQISLRSSLLTLLLFWRTHGYPSLSFGFWTATATQFVMAGPALDQLRFYGTRMRRKWLNYVQLRCVLSSILTERPTRRFTK